MRHLKLCIPLVVLCASCAHSSEKAKGQDEVTELRMRVVMLERRLSDIDVTLKVMAQSGGRIGSSSAAPSYEIEEVGEISSGQPVVANEPALDDYYVRDERESVPQAEALPLAEVPVTRENLPPKGLYKKAHALRTKGDVEAARVLFEQFSSQYPTHRLADNALYWNARCTSERGAHREAIALWQVLPLRFPTSAKLPDALYGMAKAHEALGEPVLAETLYSQLVKQYPSAESVKDAQRALQRLAGL